MQKWHFSEYPKKAECRTLVDGKVKYVSVQAFNEDNIFWGIVNDITEERLKEKRNNILAQVLHKSPDGIWITETRGDNFEPIYFSEGREKIFEKDLDYLIENEDFLLEYLHPDDVEYYKEMNNRIFDSSPMKHDELVYRIVMPDERIKKIHEIRFFEKEGDCILGCGIQRDITESNV